MVSHRPFSILFVCLGNICRSPLAEGVLRSKTEGENLAEQFMLDSCGTGAWHVGNPPDHRSVAVGAKHGVDLSELKARKIRQDDFYAFDLMLAMDRDNLASLREMQPRDCTAEIALYLDYCGLGSNLGGHDVPDPYYGGANGFDAVYEMIDRASDILLQKHR